MAERATGQSFESLMQEQVFTPLGMQVDTGPSRHGQALGHKGGKPLTGLAADIPPFFAPAGATMKMSLADWSKFVLDQMAGERGAGKLLSQQGYRFLHAPQGESSAALGWGVKSNWPAHAPMRLLMHAGSNGYWNALVALAPDTQSGVLVVANAGEGTGAEQQETRLVMGLRHGQAPVGVCRRTSAKNQKKARSGSGLKSISLEENRGDRCKYAAARYICLLYCSNTRYNQPQYHLSFT